MIYITQLIYIHEGKADIFHQFEALAIPLIKKYNGRLLLRVRPSESSFIEYQLDKPYEIHLVEFDSEKDLEAFSKDEDRKRFLHLKEESVKTVLLYKSGKI